MGRAGLSSSPMIQLGTRDLAAFYEEHQAWPPRVARSVARWLRARLGGGPREALFLGSATGVNDALPFAREAGPGDRVVSSDIEPAYLRELRRRARREARLEVCRVDITEDLSGQGTFDLVALFFVIHRIGPWRAAARRVAGLVRPGGTLAITEFAGPGGVIYLSNERGGTGRDPVARLIRRYFELLPERFEPPLKSTSIGPVLSLLGEELRPAGHRDFAWKQSLTVGEMFEKIRRRAYAPYFSTRAPKALLERLEEEFRPEWGRRVRTAEIIRVYRFVRD